MPSSEAEAAFIATCTKMNERIVPVGQALGRPVDPQVCRQVFDASKIVLEQAGVHVSGDAVSFTRDASVLFAAGPWHEDTPADQRAFTL